MSQPTGEAAANGTSKLLSSSLVVGVMTMLSRVLGLVRDVVFAIFIGASGGADAFFVAFKIPNFLRRLFAEGAFAQAFVPVLSEYRQQGSLEAVRQLISRVIGCLGVTVVTISILAVIGAPLLTFIFASGFYWQQPEKYELTASLIRITFPYLALITMAGLAGAILNSYDRFAIPAVTPVLLNLILIVAAVFVSPLMDVPALALAWAVLIAGVCQLSFQLPFLHRLDLLPKPKIDWKDTAVKRVLTLMAPALFGVSVSQINLLFDTIIASWLTDGSVSWLYYSDRLIELPLGIFGIAIATVILPTLSRQFSQDCKNYNNTLDWALRTILLISFPATIALVVLATPIIITLFQHGSLFTVHAATMASYSLVAYAFGLTAFMLIKVLVTGYFSRQDTRTPVKIGIKAMVSNMGLNILFVVPLYFYFEVGHVGLALATSASAFLNAGLLLRGLKVGGYYKPNSGWGRYITLLSCASVAMGVVLWLGLNYLPSFESFSVWQRVFNLAGLCIVGFVSYAVVLVGGGWRPSHLRPNFD